MAGSKSASISVNELRASVQGRVIVPGDAEYDARRTVFYGGHDKRPAVIVRAAHAGDVSHVITLARESGVELAVRGGGHSNAGHSVSEGGIVLDLGDMRKLEIDPPSKTAWADAGLTAGEYTTAAHEHKLATGFGDTGSVGLGGLTLGGGVGYLVRKYGLTIDDLLAAEIVTADGKQLHLDENTNPDLFWAIRGGGGNFGVATRFQFRMHDLDKVLGGMLVLPATPDVIANFMSEAEAAPEDFSAIANIMPAPPMPFLPAELHGKLIVMAMLVYAGLGAEAESTIARFRKLAKPLADMVHPMAYPEIYPPEDSSYHPIGAARTLFVDKVDKAVADLILDRIKSAKATFAVTQLRMLGGAMARVAPDATAFFHRKSHIMANVATLYEDTTEKAMHEAWAFDFANALRQGDQGAYVNFLADEGAERVRAAYPGATWERLASIKRQYDPTNLFRLNQNITPA